MSNEFEREARCKGRLLVTSSQMRGWAADEWASWLRDGIESFFAAENDKKRHGSFFPLFFNPREAPASSTLADALNNLFYRKGKGRDVLGQVLVNVSADGRFIDSAEKASFVFTLANDVVPERAVDALDNILKLHQQGLFDIGAFGELVSLAVYALAEDEDHERAPALARLLQPFIDRDDMSAISREEFYKTTAARALKPA